MLNCPKPRVLVFIVAYNAEKTITSVVRRIPRELSTLYDVDVLIIDDASADTPRLIRSFHNPVNQEDGGNQKLGYHSAIRNNCRAGRRPR